MSNDKDEEQEYFKSMSIMRGVLSLENKLGDINDIYKKVRPHAGSTYEFLHKCYVDTVWQTVGLLRFISGSVRDDIFYCPGRARDSDSDEDYDDKHDRAYLFKIAVVRALSEMNKARSRLAECLLMRSDDVYLIDDFAEYSHGKHRVLSNGHTLIELYRCLRHIHSVNGYNLKIDENVSEVTQFDMLFCQTETDISIINEYAANANKCIGDDIDMFDPVITNRNK
jgi:hypothetical protein